MSCIMVQGTSSGAGKTTIAALLCRHFSEQGFKVAPFKASNLSLNSFVTARGEEIGVSQAYQAWACGREPEGIMNPILLKPKGNGVCQVILSGRPYADVSRGGRKVERDVLLDQVRYSFHRLSEDNDVVVIEGSGSPAEINLREEDIGNMTTAEIANAPVVLVGDIERGGVFAGLYGTYSLLQDRHRRLVKAFLINRFRGDPSVLASGIATTEQLLGVPNLGVLPFVDLSFPAEDSLDMGRARGTAVRGTDVRKGWLANLDRLYEMSQEHLDFALMEKIAFS
jgi:adenosylcobyric acid synthase